ncbi:hypothetical protein [Streptomyces sp. NPDC052107]|uniref:hypothetical protein n=1 Tax=Streptomyces sp. NPDC052107 TaxID=3155632 RepID=UPI00342596BB
MDTYGSSDRRTFLAALHRCKLLAGERIKYYPVPASGAAEPWNTTPANCAGCTPWHLNAIVHCDAPRHSRLQ